MIERLYYTQHQAAKEIGIHVLTLRKMVSKYRPKFVWQKRLQGSKLSKDDVELLKVIREV